MDHLAEWHTLETFKVLGSFIIIICCKKSRFSLKKKTESNYPKDDAISDS